MGVSKGRITQVGLGVGEGDDEVESLDFRWDVRPPVTCPSSIPPAPPGVMTQRQGRQTISLEEDES